MSTTLPVDKKDFAKDFFCGGIAGLFSGVLVGPAECLKVQVQASTLSMSKLIQLPNTRLLMLQSIRPFSINFAGVCALEFSINKRIGDTYGAGYGVIASALTGASFLTAADHLMYLCQRGETTLTGLQKLWKSKPIALWTGFTPMVAREAIFIISVMHMGPWLGKILQRDSNENTPFWHAVGRLTTGVITAWISQPFDVIARAMMINRDQNPGKEPSLFLCLRVLHEEWKSTNYSLTKNPFFRGSTVRMGLATFGGTLAGGLFDWCNHQFSKNLKNDH